MGDRVPMLPNTRLVARFPVPAHVKLILKGQVVAETRGMEFNFTPKEAGAYRLEAWLDVAGEERPWIYSNPLYLYTPTPAELTIPPATLDANVKPVKNIAYTEGAPEDAAKHKLDLYLPTDKTKFPVLFFVHGGSWRSGDRSLYGALGNRFAKLGTGVVIPSYRLMPKNPHPAQVEDVAAAFAWTVKHIAEYGGDPSQIFVAGHSAGGHLVSLLALDPKYLAKYDLTPKMMRGVMALSGVYDMRSMAAFGADEAARRNRIADRAREPRSSRVSGYLLSVGLSDAAGPSPRLRQGLAPQLYRVHPGVYPRRESYFRDGQAAARRGSHGSCDATVYGLRAALRQSGLWLNLMWWALDSTPPTHFSSCRNFPPMQAKSRSRRRS